jgi:4'-phosphopantetheinyl transferase
MAPDLCDRPAPLQWPAPTTASLSLAPDDIHLWLYNTQRDPDALRTNLGTYWEILSKAEQAQASRLSRPLIQQRYIQTRATLRSLLGQYLEQSPQSLQFVMGPQGKPDLTPQSASPLHFNLSHSQDWVLYAMARKPIGVDIEQIRAFPDALRLADRFFASSEYQIIQDQPAETRDLTFLRHWVCKEAYVKATGQGIAHQLNQVVLDFAKFANFASATPQPYSLIQLQSPDPNWQLLEITPSPDLAGAIAWATADPTQPDTPLLSPRISTWRIVS